MGATPGSLRWTWKQGELFRAGTVVLDQEWETEGQGDVSLASGAGLEGLLVIAAALAPLNFKGTQHVSLNLETTGEPILRL